MKFHIILLAALFVFVTSSDQQRYYTDDFEIACIDAQQNELLFDGQCYFASNQFYSNAIAYIDYLSSIDSSLTIDDLIRNYLFQHIDEFYNKAYINNSYYLASFNELKSQYDYIAKKVETSISNIEMYELYEAFQVSNMSNVIDKLVQNNFDEFFASTNASFNDFFCDYGSGFCDKTSKMFGIKTLSDWSQLTLDKFLNIVVKNAFNLTTLRVTNNVTVFLNITRDESKIYEFVQLLKEGGTKNTKVSSLQDFINLVFFEQMIEYYNPSSDINPVKKTTTAKTTKIVTTVEPKVIAVTAVPEAALIAIPLSLVVLGAIGAAIFIYYSPIKFRRINTTSRHVELPLAVHPVVAVSQTNGKRVLEEKF